MMRRRSSSAPRAAGRTRSCRLRASRASASRVAGRGVSARKPRPSWRWPLRRREPATSPDVRSDRETCAFGHRATCPAARDNPTNESEAEKAMAPTVRELEAPMKVEPAVNTTLKQTLKQKIEAHRPRTARLVKELGKIVIDQVTIDQCIGGARDIRALVTDISYLDPQEGIRF